GISFVYKWRAEIPCRCLLTKLSQDRFHVLRKRRFKLNRVSVCGGAKRGPPGMQRLSRERDWPQHIGPEHVALFADECMAPQPSLQSNLVALSRPQADLDQ